MIKWKSTTKATTSPKTEPVPMNAAAATGAVLHEIDYQDLAISPQGITMIKKAARAVIDQYMPAVDSRSITVREAMALFVDRVFWDERTGGLFMCTDLANRSVCLPLASQHWTVRPVTPVQ